MTSGGRRNRNHLPDPKSARSERLGFKLTALPAQGFSGDAPEWPLPPRACFYKETDENGRQVRVFDNAETERVKEREGDLWSWAWTTPQACAWSMPSESWRLMTIAMYIRTYVLCESSEATAADKSSLHRFADQIGMTPAGLRENGWAVAVDDVGAKAAERDAAPAAPKRERRLRAAGDQ